MLEKTKGIILHQIKYTDSGIVAQVYTREFGRRSFLIKGLRNKKSGKHNILFQPLFILDMVFYNKESCAIQMLKEFSVSFAPTDIYCDVKKSCIAIFLGEILNSVLREESPHKEMFDYIENSIIYFEGSKTGYINFHIAFLTGLSAFLGFEPGQRTDHRNVYFDMLNGTFVPAPPLHGSYTDAEISDILSVFFKTSYDNMNNITLTGALRNEVLETIVKYYSLHLPGLKKINSLGVLKEIFS
ncbi:MAG TPA: DNA repair protein RecO [Bacteroidales bacterium]|nr:DNA repair protein RecO [Bacteroidales bacterium]